MWNDLTKFSTIQNNMLGEAKKKFDKELLDIVEKRFDELLNPKKHTDLLENIWKTSNTFFQKEIGPLVNFADMRQLISLSAIEQLQSQIKEEFIVFLTHVKFLRVGGQLQNLVHRHDQYQIYASKLEFSNKSAFHTVEKLKKLFNVFEAYTPDLFLLKKKLYKDASFFFSTEEWNLDDICIGTKKIKSYWNHVPRLGNTFYKDDKIVLGTAQYSNHPLFRIQYNIEDHDREIYNIEMPISFSKTNCFCERNYFTLYWCS